MELASSLTDVIIDMKLPPLGIMAVLIFFYLFIGCVMDLMSILIITLPVVFPLVTGMGFDPYAMCIVLVFLIAIGSITPPFGLSCFVVASAADVDPMDVFLGIIPFFIAMVALVWIFILIPGLVTWLPNLLF